LANGKLENASARGGGRDLCSRQIQLLSETDGRTGVDVSVLPQADVDVSLLPQADIDVSLLPQADVDVSLLPQADVDVSLLPQADVDVSLLLQADGRSCSHCSDLGQSSAASIQLRKNNGLCDKSARNTIKTAREVVTKATDTSRTSVLNHQHAAVSYSNQLTQARENVQRKVCNDNVTPAYLPVFMDRKSREVSSVSYIYG
jgi:hypothetical protein